MGFNLKCNECGYEETINLERKEDRQGGYRLGTEKFEIKQHSYNGDTKIECLNCGHKIASDILGHSEKEDIYCIRKWKNERS